MRRAPGMESISFSAATSVFCSSSDVADKALHLLQTPVSDLYWGVALAVPMSPPNPEVRIFVIPEIDVEAKVEGRTNGELEILSLNEWGDGGCLW